MRRILILSSALVFVDMLYLSILTPMLPTYVGQLGLTETEAGLFSSAYAWGAVAAALPSGFLAQNLGPRKVICWGLVALSATSLVFAWASGTVLLDLARFAQGICGAVIWSGALTWLIGLTPEDRRGTAIGTLTGAGGVGAVLGPVVGALAVAIGPEWLFIGMPILLLTLCVAVATSTDAHRFERQSVRFVATAALSRPLLNAFLFLGVPTLGFGLLVVLMPLKVHQLGGSASLIAGAFVAAAAIETLLAPVSGHWSDGAGRRTPYLAGLGIVCVALALMATTNSLAVAVMVVPFSSIGGGLYISPAFALLSDAAQETGLAQSHAFALSNTAFALGLAAGSLIGGLIAGAVGVDAPFVVMIGVLAIFAAYAVRSPNLTVKVSPS